MHKPNTNRVINIRTCTTIAIRKLVWRVSGAFRKTGIGEENYRSGRGSLNTNRIVDCRAIAVVATIHKLIRCVPITCCFAGVGEGDQYRIQIKTINAHVHTNRIINAGTNAIVLAFYKLVGRETGTLGKTGIVVLNSTAVGPCNADRIKNFRAVAAVSTIHKLVGGKSCTGSKTSIGKKLKRPCGRTLNANRIVNGIAIAIAVTRYKLTGRKTLAFCLAGIVEGDDDGILPDVVEYPYTNRVINVGANTVSGTDINPRFKRTGAGIGSNGQRH